MIGGREEEFDGRADQDEIASRFDALFDELFDAADMFHLQDIDDERPMANALCHGNDHGDGAAHHREGRMTEEVEQFFTRLPPVFQGVNDGQRNEQEGEFPADQRDVVVKKAVQFAAGGENAERCEYDAKFVVVLAAERHTEKQRAGEQKLAELEVFQNAVFVKGLFFADGGDGVL